MTFNARFSDIFHTNVIAVTTRVSFHCRCPEPFRTARDTIVRTQLTQGWIASHSEHEIARTVLEIPMSMHEMPSAEHKTPSAEHKISRYVDKVCFHVPKDRWTLPKDWIHQNPNSAYWPENPDIRVENVVSCIRKALVPGRTRLDGRQEGSNRAEKLRNRRGMFGDTVKIRLSWPGNWVSGAANSLD